MAAAVARAAVAMAAIKSQEVGGVVGAGGGVVGEAEGAGRTGLVVGLGVCVESAAASEAAASAAATSERGWCVGVTEGELDSRASSSA